MIFLPRLRSRASSRSSPPRPPSSRTTSPPPRWSTPRHRKRIFLRCLRPWRDEPKSHAEAAAPEGSRLPEEPAVPEAPAVVAELEQPEAAPEAPPAYVPPSRCARAEASLETEDLLRVVRGGGRNRPELERQIVRFNACQQIVYRAIPLRRSAPGASNFVRFCAGRPTDGFHEIFADVGLTEDGAWEPEGCATLSRAEGRARSLGQVPAPARRRSSRWSTCTWEGAGPTAPPAHRRIRPSRRPINTPHRLDREAPRGITTAVVEGDRR